jgi:putative endonuclease
MEKQTYVYLMTNRSNSVIYTGVTTDLLKRIYEHKSKTIKGFTSQYNVNKLVYYEVFDNTIEAIAREKQIKGGSRA